MICPEGLKIDAELKILSSQFYTLTPAIFYLLSEKNENKRLIN